MTTKKTDTPAVTGAQNTAPVTPTDRDLMEAAAARARSEQDRGSGAQSRRRDESELRERPALDAWAPPGMLELPPNDAQYVYRFIAEYTNGQYMATRLSAAKREGYEFLRIAELPEGFIVDEDVKGDGLARVGGLIMARLPRRFAEQRRAYYSQRAAERLAGADELQGVAGANAVRENRGTRTLDGRAAGEALASMARG